MNKLNHANLTTYDVPSLTHFFQTVFGLQVQHEQGSSLAVLTDAEGFLLTLMFSKNMTPDAGYPGFFHVGFLRQNREEVEALHATLTAAHYVAPAPAKLQRGGPPTYGFYCQAPGGVTVEVSTMAA